jgi:hypothetical protein
VTALMHNSAHGCCPYLPQSEIYLGEDVATHSDDITFDKISSGLRKIHFAEGRSRDTKYRDEKTPDLENVAGWFTKSQEAPGWWSMMAKLGA